MRWPKYWSFSFSIIPSKEIPGLIFRMDWLDLLAVQGMSGHDGPEHRKRGSKQARHRFGVIVWVQLFTLPIPEYPMQDKASRVSVSSLQNETNNSLWGIELLRAGLCNH